MSWLSPSAEDRRQAQALRDHAPTLHRLALVLAPALRIEPLLLRNARARFLPGAGADTEQEFWFSGLIDSRSQGAVVMHPGLARTLADRLTEPGRADNRDLSRQTVRDFVLEHARHWPLLDRLEQALRLSAIEGDAPPLREHLRRLLRTLIEENDPERRRDLARWIKGALSSNVPDELRSEEHVWLSQFATGTLGDASGTLAAHRDAPRPLPRWLGQRLPPTPYSIGIRLRPGVLECLPATAGGHTLELATPPPVPILLRCEAPSRTSPYWVTVWAGRRVDLEADCTRLTIQTLTGQRYRLTVRDTVLHTKGTEPTESVEEPQKAAVTMAFHPEDGQLAQRIAEFLHEKGIPVDLRPDTDQGPEGLLQGPAERPVMRLWTWTAAKQAELRATEAQRPAPTQQLVLRLEDAPLPEGLTQAPTLDLLGWAGDPWAKDSERLLKAVTVLLRETPDVKDEAEAAPAAETETSRKARGPTPDSEIPAPDRGRTSEIEALLAKIDDPATPPERRLKIGDRLAKLGDPRPGVGLRADGLPDMDWVAVPAGRFLYGEKKEKRDLDSFWSARYPVTNVQYQAFIDDGGYRDTRWWEGLAEHIRKPQDPTWSEPNRPRESVSWYEAVAYTRWLSARLGLEITLPTESQWEKTARGEDGREYPWGHRYRAGFANVDERNIEGGQSPGQTTAVGLYPKGASPYGVLDLSGNVWEWCLNRYDKPEDIDLAGRGVRVLRGGSWLYLPDYARVDYRGWFDPGGGNDVRGFRVLCVSPMPTGH
jgi:formylglycine-generating enzyme required for sulfatase activity